MRRNKQRKLRTSGEPERLKAGKEECVRMRPEPTTSKAAGRSRGRLKLPT